MIKFNNTYTQLPNEFYKVTEAQKLQHPTLIEVNKTLALELGIDVNICTNDELANIFSGQTLLRGAANISLIYAGHQFGHFNPRLGDGRALLLGEVLNKKNQRYDIQLKGSGRTPYSRGGDGKSSLGPVIREYIMSEAMNNLGVKTTRALAAVTTGEDVYRENIEPGGVFTRVASSHIRIGTFEYFAAQSDLDSLAILLDYTIERHYPHIDINRDDKVLNFLQSVAIKQSELVAKWMSIGFIHGVMNTDNMSICGETIDYGPCAFMDEFSQDKVFSYIDRHARYAYNNQMNIAKWNLYKLASTLVPLVDNDETMAISKIEDSFQNIEKLYNDAYLNIMVKKFGINTAKDEDLKMVSHWLNYLEEEKLDFTNTFNELSNGISKLKETQTLKDFSVLWKSRLKEQNDENLAKELMRDHNPIFIPRNHMVEKAIQESFKGVYTTFNELNEIMKTPFREQPHFDIYRNTPKPDEVVKNTFCGT
jgi:uncharacterized protein YdiU (UPF0061 family)